MTGVNLNKTLDRLSENNKFIVLAILLILGFYIMLSIPNWI